MKKQIITLILTGILIITYTGCKKPDKTAPVITLKGDNPFVVVLNTPYNEPGFSAMDNKDGDISSKVRTSWSPDFNKDKTGAYTISYIVDDAASNADTAKRTVYVTNSCNFLCGKYLNVGGECNITGPVSYMSNVIANTTVNGDMTISNFGGYGVTLNAVLSNSGDTITIPAGQSLGGTKTMTSSTVFFSYTPPAMYIFYSWTDGHNIDSCYMNYTR